MGLPGQVVVARFIVAQVPARENSGRAKMKLNRQVQVTSRDNHRRWFIRQGASQRRELCAVCGQQIQMVRLEEAAAAVSVELQTIHTLIEAGRLHSVETDEALLLVCLNSLINFRMNPD
jgi:hypothetical protein